MIVRKYLRQLGFINNHKKYLLFINVDDRVHGHPWRICSACLAHTGGNKMDVLQNRVVSCEVNDSSVRTNVKSNDFYAQYK